MPLALRAFLLVLLALLPAVVVQLHLEAQIRTDRGEAARAAATRLALLVNAEQGRILESAAQTLVALSADPIVAAARPSRACDATLAGVLTRELRYVFVQLLSAAGELVCGAPGPLTRTLGSASLTVAPDAVATLGRYTPLPDGAGAALPVSLRLPDGSALVLGFDLAWLNREVEALPIPPGGAVLLADAEGVVLARAPDPGRFVGRPLPPAFRRLLTAEEPGLIEAEGVDGVRRTIAYVPPTVEPLGLYAGVGIETEEALRAAMIAERRNTALVLGSLIVGVLLLFASFHRSVIHPLDRLIATVGHWTRGEWFVRSRIRGAGREFRRLSESFDAMAKAIERREADRRDNDERLRALLEVSPQLAFISDDAGMPVWCNQAWGVAGGEWWRVAVAEDQAALSEAWPRARADGTTLEAQARIALPDGSRRWFLFRVARVMRSGAQPLWAGVALDVHGLRLAEETAAAAAARLSATYEAAPVGLALIASDGTCLAANSTLVGEAAGGAAGRPLAEVEPRFARVAGPLLAEVSASGHPAVDIELRDAPIGEEERVLLCNLRAVAGPGSAVSAAVLDVTARRRAEDRERRLAREVDHRARNLLAIVSGLLRVSAAAGQPMAAFVETLEGRIGALTRAHAELSQAGWDGIELQDLVVAELGATIGFGRCDAAGPPLRLPAETALPLGLILHELAVNAREHGALATSEGRVVLRWTAAPGGTLVTWEERGGPAPAAPTLGGGFRLMRMAAAQLGGALRPVWDAAGLRCEIHLPDRRAEATSAPA
ncbi:MAG: PAS domain-containing protein [Acetobacteraceae bacterium]|nr:PAS domain-containing protein [Acetobacteraceae bacterium]